MKQITTEDLKIGEKYVIGGFIGESESIFILTNIEEITKEVPPPSDGFMTLCVYITKTINKYTFKNIYSNKLLILDDDICFTCYGFIDEVDSRIYQSRYNAKVLKEELVDKVFYYKTYDKSYMSLALIKDIFYIDARDEIYILLYDLDLQEVKLFKYKNIEIDKNKKS